MSNVLVAGPSSSKSYLDEVRKIQGSSGVPKKVTPFTQGTIPDQSMLMSSGFSGLNNCNTTISPQNFHVHMQPSVQATHDEFDEFDSLVKSIPPF